MGVTLKKITSDILYLLRSSKVSQSENISKRQIQYHVHNNRALLLKRIVDKKEHIPDDFFQYLKCFELEVADKADCNCTITSGCSALKSTLEIPKYYDKRFFSLMTLEGKPIQVSTEDRAFFNQYRPYVNNSRFAFLKDNYLWLINDKFIKYVTVRGVFLNPMDLENYFDSCDNTPCFSVDDKYPIPNYLLPQLNSLVLKEFGIIYQTMSDNINDSSMTLQPKVEQKQ